MTKKPIINNEVIGRLEQSPIHNKERFRFFLEDIEAFKFLCGVYSAAFDATNEYFRTSKGMESVMSPITTASISSPMGLGSDSEPVEIEMFGEKICLADSMQFFLEYLLRASDKGVYYIMPTFRGEEHDETHLNQFFHAEAEIVGGLEELLELIEGYVKELTHSVVNFLEENNCAVPVSDSLLQMIDNKNFLRIDYNDALKELENVSDAIEINEDGSKVISKVGENYLSKIYGIFWLTGFPAKIVPFYQKRKIDAPEYTETADLIFPVIGEIVGCGARHVGAKELVQAIEDMDVHEPESYDWYITMKEITPIETSGFGLGVERFLSWILGIDDIRKVVLLSRLKGDESYI